MTTAYTSLLGLALPVTGELAGTWGDVVSNYITKYLDSAVAGTQTISGNQTAVTLSVTNGSALTTVGSGSTGSSQYTIINCTGNPAGLLTITVPAQSKVYLVINATSTSQSVKVVGTGPTTGVTIISGEKALIAWNGTDFVKVATAGGSGTFYDVTVTNSATLSYGTANGVLYLNASKVATSGSALTFDGTNFGIGASSSYPLGVSTNANSAQRIELKNSNAGASASGIFQITNDASNSLQLIQYSSGAGAGAAIQQNSGGTLTLTTITDQAIIFKQNNTEGMRLTSTGLGIGTSSPSYKLDVQAATAVTQTKSTTGTNAAYYVANNTGGDFYIGRENSAGTTFGTTAYSSVLWAAGAYPMSFFTNGTERMRLDSTGLGIGTSSPGYKLDVAGQAKTTNGFIVNNGTNAGFFTTDGTNVNFGSSTSGKGLALFVGAASQAALFDTSGNLGLGVTPSAWWSSDKAFQIYGGTFWAFSGNNSNVNVATNSYQNSSNNPIYISTDYAAKYAQVSGAHQWYIAPSGTAGNAISFTQAMTLDASGNLSLNAANASFVNTYNNGQLTIGTNTGTGASTVIQGPSYISFTTYSGSFLERARIDTNGNLLVGATSSIGGDCRIGSYFDGASINGMNLKDSSSSTGGYYVGFYNASNTFSGGINHNGTATVSYNTSSDYRLKDNQQLLTNSGAFIDALKPKTWTWKADGNTGVGFIAHEVQEVSPSSVVGKKDGEQMQGMEYGSPEFIANIIAELQSLRKRVAQLEGK